MDRRAFLKCTTGAGLGLGALATGFTGMLGRRAGAAVDWAKLKGKFAVELHSHSLGHVSGTLNVKKNKATREPGWREITGSAKSTRGKLNGWIHILPGEDHKFQIGRVTNKRGTTTWVSGEAEVSSDGTVITGTYMVRRGDSGALIPVEWGSFTLTRV